MSPSSLPLHTGHIFMTCYGHQTVLCDVSVCTKHTHFSVSPWCYVPLCWTVNPVRTYCFKVWNYSKPQNCSLNDTTIGDRPSRLGVAISLLRTEDLEAPGVIFMPNYGKSVFCYITDDRISIQGRTDGQTHACCQYYHFKGKELDNSPLPPVRQNQSGVQVLFLKNGW